jgi:hypothetical protein
VHTCFLARDRVADSRLLIMRRCRRSTILSVHPTSGDSRFRALPPIISACVIEFRRPQAHRGGRALRRRHHRHAPRVAAVVVAHAGVAHHRVHGGAIWNITGAAVIWWPCCMGAMGPARTMSTAAGA